MKWQQILTLLSFLLLPPLSTRQLRASSSPDGSLVPYLAVGGDGTGLHFETLLVVGNPSRDSTAGVIDVYDEDIQPLPIALDGDRGLQAEFPWQVPPGMARKFILSHPGDSIRSGWIRVKTSGKSDLDLIVVLRLYDGETLLSEDGLIFPSMGKGLLRYASVSLPARFLTLLSQFPPSGRNFDWGGAIQPAMPAECPARQNIAPPCQEKKFRLLTKFKEL